LNTYTKFQCSKFKKFLKIMFDFILFWVQFKFSLKIFKTSLFWIKYLDFNLKSSLQPNYQFGPNSIFLGKFLCRPRPPWPFGLAQAHPGPFSFVRTPKLPLPIQPRHHAACHRQPPSHTGMEPNQSTAQPPSLSRTSSVPRRLPSLIQCRNRRD
jgi:hypothetical protein